MREIGDDNNILIVICSTKEKTKQTKVEGSRKGGEPRVYEYGKWDHFPCSATLTHFPVFIFRNQE